ncbi:MAG: MFS transporter, partial [Planctomycetaceae bacterium]
EAVANPLVATVFPHNRTHYLNILHASWPAGMVLGSVAGWYLDDKLHLDWKYQLALYLVPTVIYALMFLGQTFPKSEAAAKGASFVDMFRDVGILGAAVACFLLALFFGDILKDFMPEQAAAAGYVLGGLLLLAVAFMTRFSVGSLVLFVLFITHALVGAVELGTDSWIQNITGNLFTSEQGKWLFIWTSAIMFGLRFCAHFIETKIGLSPIGLLLVSAVLAFLGLRFASGMNTFPAALAALGIYALGKTFFWPTMLAVVGDRFPQTGAIAMSIMGGIGMLSAGLMGGRDSATARIGLPDRHSRKPRQRCMRSSSPRSQVDSSTSPAPRFSASPVKKWQRLASPVKPPRRRRPPSQPISRVIAIPSRPIR